ncbi:MAG: hypothetical protein FD161_951 [Limisphaerales bacterium]|nr:MAG: hypothetical protein FD161_951 [Limisphaerales bacterium]KAG0509933.1 MAG: hypothetical protein E1N63_951 [Limisphaerales bacterium]TXT46190.1 MAG: hypothetical protein FD140_4527 [Limisphaerales bacterium]
MTQRCFLVCLWSLLAALSCHAAPKPADAATWWSYQPVVRPALPAVKNSGWVRNDVDRFILARLEVKGLRPSPEADPRTLIRRLYFDLLGLPPTPEEVEAFVRECSSIGNRQSAIAKLVDKLLASPHYGERWARHWLDIAHYADTHGFERDQLRPNAWRYRDYVIAALNADKPYDQFLREQIAGDVLAEKFKVQGSRFKVRDGASSAPDQTNLELGTSNLELVAATGFLAAGPWDFVGQVETRSDMLKRAARADDLDDIVTQVLTASMGVTINCARCHDHKLDPISQREYYGLWAVFSGVKRGDRELDPAATARREVERQPLQTRLREITTELGRLTGEGLDLADMVGGGNGRGNGVKGAGLDLRTGNVVKDKLGYHRDIQVNRRQKPEWPDANAPKFVQWIFLPDGKSPVQLANQVTVSNLPPTSGHAWDAIRNGPLNAQVSTKLDGVDFATAGHSILGLHANAGITFDLAEIRKASGFAKLRFTAQVGFGAGPSAATTRADFSVFAGKELLFQKLKLRKDESTRVDVALPDAAGTLTLIATDGGDGIGHDLLFLGDARLALDRDLQALAAADRARIESLRAEEKQLTIALNAKADPEKVYAITNTEPAVVRLLRRGNPEDAQEEVGPGTLGCVKHAPADFARAKTEGERRLALAEWITHPANPLTRRVLVNRLWHHHFGMGIVDTPSDFGKGGGLPSHPELLDWLAEEFLARGWSLKALHRLICTSATYQQSSSYALRVTDYAAVKRKEVIRKEGVADATVLDSSNRLLWRQNPRRLDAESTRDAVLAVSGKLNLDAGGPGWRDFKYTEAYAPIYQYVTADTPELWRRSIYRFIVRTTPHQFMTTLDCPNPANLTPARTATTTALQALTLSNNEFMLQQARHLATRVERETGADPAAQITRAFQLAFARPPSQPELAAARDLVRADGVFPLCRMLLNANEFVYVD